MSTSADKAANRDRTEVPLESAPTSLNNTKS
jgi:hypothetical protein